MPMDDLASRLQVGRFGEGLRPPAGGQSRRDVPVRPEARRAGRHVTRAEDPGEPQLDDHSWLAKFETDDRVCAQAEAGVVWRVDSAGTPRGRASDLIDHARLPVTRRTSTSSVYDEGPKSFHGYHGNKCDCVKIMFW